MSEPEFSVVIVSYNSGDYLQGAITSLARQTFRDFEVILLDNASEDGAIDRLDLSGLDDVEVLLFKETDNHGFARGNNLGARRAKGKWLALLNPDAEAEPDWLDQLRAARTRHPGVNVFASCQLSLEQPGQLDGAGDAYLVFGFPWRGGFENPVSRLPAEGTCFAPCGASAVYDRELFLSLGGFDERFFCYCEDVDLGFRMQLEGEQCVFLPDAVVRHAGSGTTGRDSYFTAFHGNRNRLWTYVKNMPLPLLLLTFPGHLAILAYVYLRNRDRFEHSGMTDGVKAGFKSAWSLRGKGPYKTRHWPRSWRAFLTSMAWNPFVIRDRRPHVREASLDSASRERVSNIS